MNELTDFLDSAGGIAGNVLGGLQKPAPTIQVTAAPKKDWRENFGAIVGIGLVAIGFVMLIVLTIQRGK